MPYADLEQRRLCDRLFKRKARKTKAYRVYIAAYRTTHKREAAKRMREYRKRNKAKVKARNLLTYAIASGKIRKRPCEVCGRKAQAHHEDYTKPLDVRWLCRKHHGAEHRKAA